METTEQTIKLPEAFAARMRDILGEAYAAFAAELTSAAPVRALRVNTIKTTADRLLPSLTDAHCTPIPYAADGYLTDLEKPGQLPQHHAGMFYMQDPSAMSTVHAMDIRPGWRVLDLCAAPGGKSTQLAAYLGDDGVLVANEYVASRCRILQGNIERMGCRNTVVTHLDPAEVARCYPGYFDLAVGDAPCSGEGMFRKNELALTEWSEENVAMCAERQRTILESAAKCVAPGGYLLYSTCTFSPAENEENVVWFLSTHPDYHLCPVQERLLPYTAPGLNLSDRYDLTLTRRFYPHVAHGEGQYVALLVREGDAASRIEKSVSGAMSPTADEIKAASAFLRDTLKEAPQYALIRHRDLLCFCPAVPLPPHGVFCCGVPLGTLQKGRIAPEHHFFSAYGKTFWRQFSLSSSDVDALAYIRGMTLSADSKENGWCAVLLDGAPLGGGKIAAGILKNHYPKGLRQ